MLYDRCIVSAPTMLYACARFEAGKRKYRPERSHASPRLMRPFYGPSGAGPGLYYTVSFDEETENSLERKNENISSNVVHDNSRVLHTVSAESVSRRDNPRCVYRHCPCNYPASQSGSRYVRAPLVPVRRGNLGTSTHTQTLCDPGGCSSPQG